MNTNFIRFPATDDLHLEGLLYEPEEPTQIAILHVHGMGGNFYENTFLDEMAEQYTTAGYAFFPFNNRGRDSIASMIQNGNFTQQGNAFERFEDCIKDIEAARQRIAEEGYNNIILQTHSLGCNKAVYYYTHREGNEPTGLILLSPPDMIALEREHSRLLETAERMCAEDKENELIPEVIYGEYIMTAGTYVNFFGKESSLDLFRTGTTTFPSKRFQ